MSRIWAIAWREFKHTALTKAFLISAIAFPIVIWSVFPVIVMLTEQRSPPLEGTLVIVDPTGEMVPAVRQELDARRVSASEAAGRLADDLRRDPGAMIDSMATEDSLAAITGDAVPVDLQVVAAASADDLDALKERVRLGTIVAVAVIDADAIAPAEDDEPTAAARLFVGTDMQPAHTRLLSARIAEATVRVRAERRGENVASLRRLLRRPEVSQISLGAGDDEQRNTTEVKEILPFAFMALLVICAMTSGQYLLTTTIEEKSNRVMEVLLSAVSPLELMTGKIVGQGLVSLVMLVMYGGLGITALIVFATTDLISTTDVALFVIYFAMAYYYSAATMASVGSAVSDLHEAQSLMLPAMSLLLFAPMLLMFPASQDPNGLVATVASFVPPFTPYVMVVRITAGDVPVWQIAASLVVGLGGVAAAMWIAAKVFRVGVLMYGKPPSPLEMLRWVRYS